MSITVPLTRGVLWLMRGESDVELIAPPGLNEKGLLYFFPLARRMRKSLSQLQVPITPSLMDKTDSGLMLYKR
uniref:Uncharacterized protein n=1 Tax=Anguilla anguilla TaxID=7936 RepID=A0A0E9T0Y7_ANGAN